MDAAINLVPYIDMLMTIMTFLMMTAVWTQIAMLEVQNASGGQDQQQDQPDPTKPKPIMIIATATKVGIQEEGGEAKEGGGAFAWLGKKKGEEAEGKAGEGQCGDQLDGKSIHRGFSRFVPGGQGQQPNADRHHAPSQRDEIFSRCGHWRTAGLPCSWPRHMPRLG